MLTSSALNRRILRIATSLAVALALTCTSGVAPAAGSVLGVYSYIRGHVYDAETGLPVSGSGEVWTGSGGGGLMVAADGSYQILGTIGYNCTIWLKMNGYHDAWYGGSAVGDFATYFLLGEEDVEGVDLYLDRPGTGAISGNLVDTYGRPLRAARIVAYRPVPGHGLWDPVEVLSVTGPKGEFCIPRLPAATYRLGVVMNRKGTPDFWYGGTSLETATDLTLAEGEHAGPITIQLPQVIDPRNPTPPIESPYPGTLSTVWYYSQVIDGASGLPVPNLNFGQSRFSGGLTSDIEGWIDLLSYKQANSTFWVNSTDTWYGTHWDGQPGVDYAQYFYIGNSSEWGFNVILSRKGESQLSGRLLWPDGSPVASQRVVALVYCPKLGVWDQVEVLATTSSTGDFSIGGLPSGRYRIALARPDGGTMGQVARVTTDTPSECDVDGTASCSLGDLTMHPRTIAVGLTAAENPVAVGATTQLSGTLVESGAHGGSIPTTTTVVVESSSDGVTYVAREYLSVSDGQFSASTDPVYQKTYWRVRTLVTQEYDAATSAPLLVSNPGPPTPDPGDDGDSDEPAGPQLVRVAGANRIATAIRASRRAYPKGAETVVVATSEDWPDALGGTALAGVVNGPLLLTDSMVLSPSVADEIVRLGASSAYVLGGTKALSADVEESLGAELGGDVTRLRGADRYATAKAVADEVIALQGTAYSGEAFVCTGDDFPDALGASPLAAAWGAPIVLTRKDAAPPLPDAVQSATILGGYEAVSVHSEAYVNQVLGYHYVRRIAGSSRYQTAALVADYGVSKGLNWDELGIATGTEFPDGLAGGPMIGSMGSVMLLTKPDSLASVAKTRLGANAGSIGTVHIVGGSAAVADSVCDEVARALQ